MRFYLDQNVTPRLTAAARQLGVDVTNWQEDGLEDATDEQQLAHATQQGRVIVTRDVEDFSDLGRRWLREGRQHCGILLLSREIGVNDTGIAARALLRLHSLYPEDTVENVTLWLNLDAGR